MGIGRHYPWPAKAAGLAMILLAAFLTGGCVRVKNILPGIEGGKTVATDQAVVFLPDKMPSPPAGMVYIITADGSRAAAQAYIGSWRGLAADQGYMLACPLDWEQETLGPVMEELKRRYRPEKTVVTGFSHGGYVSCHFGLRHPDGIDAIIPMGAYCQAADLTVPPPKAVPMLAIAGEKDDWARGEEGGDMETAKRELAAAGLVMDVYLVPDIGHVFPATAMPVVSRWIKRNLGK